MSIFASSRFLPRVMAADALSQWTGLPAALLTGTGVFLLPWALLAAWIARRPVPPRRPIGLVAIGNLALGRGCGALLTSGPVTLTAWGVAWVLAQAVVVVGLAALQ